MNRVFLNHVSILKQEIFEKWKFSEKKTLKQNIFENENLEKRSNLKNIFEKKKMLMNFLDNKLEKNWNKTLIKSGLAPAIYKV